MVVNNLRHVFAGIQKKSGQSTCRNTTCAFELSHSKSTFRTIFVSVMSKIVMKKILPILAGVFLIMAVAAPDHKKIILEQFSRTQGEWDGFMEYTDFSDNKSKFSMPAKCKTSFDGKKWVYEVQYDEGNGEFVGGGGECTLNGDGTKLDNNGILWNITDVQQNGDTVRILMETNGKDNRKKATLRQTFDVTSKTFSITEEVKYLDQTNYFVRNKHLFRKKK